MEDVGYVFIVSKLSMVRYGKTITYLFIPITFRSRNTPYKYKIPLSLTRRGVRGEVIDSYQTQKATSTQPHPPNLHLPKTSHQNSPQLS